MTRSRRNGNLAMEVIAVVLAVGAVDLTFFRADLSVGASLGLFTVEVMAAAIVWIAASLLLERQIHWGLQARSIERRHALATVGGGCVFFVLLTGTILAFGWRSMSFVPIVVTALLVWRLLTALLDRRTSDDETRNVSGGFRSWR